MVAAQKQVDDAASSSGVANAEGVALAVFVKTPEYSAVKTRLAQEVGTAKARAVYEACLAAMRDLMCAVQDATASAPQKIIPHWAVGERAATTHPRWHGFPTLWTGDGGLGERLSHVYSTLLAHHSRVILIGSDCPQIPVASITTAANQRGKVVFAPATDGGFYLFAAGIPIAKSLWCAVPYSQANTLAQLQQQLQPHPQTTLPPLTDIDTVASFQQVLQELKAHPARRHFRTVR